jgi:hypothetical protein
MVAAVILAERQGKVALFHYFIVAQLYLRVREENNS